MKKSTELTVSILREIRGELKTLGARVDAQTEATNAGFGELRVELQALAEATNARFEELGHRIVDSELRTATALTDLSGTVREMTSVLRQQADLRPRVERCERDIDDIKRRLPEAS